MESNVKYLVDANVLITAYRQYYGFDIVPSFWREILPLFSGSVCILDKVWKELVPNEKRDADELGQWLLTHEKDIKRISTQDREVIQNYGYVLNFLNESEAYTKKALDAWSPANIADPWLIAAAKKYNAIIVTNETETPSPVNNPINKPKIPTVAKHFAVITINTYELMRKCNIKI